MMLRATALLAATAAVAACGDDDSSDGIDAPTDATDAIDAPNGVCGVDYQMTGEYIDWVATNATSDGVEDAVWTVVGEATRTATTAPNGRIILCLSRSAPVTITVVQGAYVEALFVADPAVLSPSGGIFSARGLKVTETAIRYDELMTGMTFDAGLGHVLVVKRGTPGVLGLGGQDSYVSDGVDDITWTPGDTGRFTMFPNVPLGMQDITGTFTGPRTVPVQAGKLTIVPIAN